MTDRMVTVSAADLKHALHHAQYGTCSGDHRDGTFGRLRAALNARDDEREVEIIVLSGVEGLAVYIDNYRVTGPKPWGGGDVWHEWKVKRSDVLYALTRRRGR